MIDITMTATLRAGIVERTLRSFKQKLFKDHPARMVINVDPAGPDDGPAGVMRAAYAWFDVGFARMPAKPSFPLAFKWAWSHAEAEYIFHLEDDWELLAPVDLGAMIRIMELFPDLAVLRLPFKPAGKSSMKNWKVFFPWNGWFFECPPEHRREVGFCGHPSLIRGEFIRNTVKYLNETRNPEKQFHHGPSGIMREVDRRRFGVYGEPEGPALIRDIGRPWMIQNGLRKAGNKAFFTQWEEVND